MVSSGPDAHAEDMESASLPDGGPLRLHDSVPLAPIRLGGGVEPVVLDWFGRGGADLLLVSEADSDRLTAHVFRRCEATDQQPLTYNAGIPVPDLNGLRCLCPIPNGGPSRFDLVALGAEELLYLANEGTADAPRFSGRRALGFPANLGLGPGRIAQMIAEDWDGDGRVDLVIGFDEMTDYWPDESANIPRVQQTGFNQLGGHPGYDSHGRWRGRAPRGRLFWMRNTGDAGSPRFERPEEIVGEGNRVDVDLRPAALTVAWSGGSAVELLLTDRAGTVRLHRNFGGQRPPVLMDPRPLLVAGRPLRLPDDRTTVIAVDLDGDQHPELVFGGGDGRVFAVRRGKVRDTAAEPVALLAHDPILRLGANAVVSAADLDGDGDLDLVAGDASGRLHLIEDLGGRRYAAPVEIEASGQPFRLNPGPDGRLNGPAGPNLGFACPMIADWDGNGRLDLVVSGAGGEVLFFHHNGSAAQPRWERPIALRCDGGPLIIPPRVRPGVAHWTGGDLPDLIALNLQGFLCVYPRTGAHEVGPPRPIVDRLGRVIRLDGAFGQAGRCALWVGPWTRPDTLDILVGLPLGARHVVPALTGAALTAIETLPTVLLLEAIGPDMVVPRPIHHGDGPALVVGVAGCAPCGASRSDSESHAGLDLLVGSDDGRVFVFQRDALRW